MGLKDELLRISFKKSGPCPKTALLFLDCSSLVSAFPPLRSLITETCSRASIVARLISQNGLGQNGFSYIKKAIPGSLSLVTP